MGGRAKIANTLAKLADFFETRAVVLNNGGLWEGTNGAGHVRPLPGPQTQAHNRELLAVNKPAAAAVVAGDLHTATWAAVEDVTEITVTVALGATASLTVNSPLDAGIYIAFDAPSDALAASWLSEISHTATDSQRYFVKVGDSRTFRFTANILRADCIASFNSTNNDFNVILEAN